MNKQKPTRQVNDYVLLFSAGAALSVVFLWIASYIFPEGEIIGGRRVFENIPKSIQYIFLQLRKYSEKKMSFFQTFSMRSSKNFMLNQLLKYVRFSKIQN